MPTVQSFGLELQALSGSGFLSITIGTDGKVEDVKVIGGDKAFIDPVVSLPSSKSYTSPNC
jgi:hypothetical protein